MRISKLIFHYRNFLIILVVLTGLRVPRFLADFIVNYSLVNVLKESMCYTNWMFCGDTVRIDLSSPNRHEENTNIITHQYALLQKAAYIDPENIRINIHLAEFLFVLEKGKDAAQLLREKGLFQDPILATEQNLQKTNWISPLLAPWRYEYHIVTGYNQMGVNRLESVRQFQWGLAEAGERALPQDIQAFYESVGQQYLDKESSSDRLLAGKYFIFAGENDKANDILTTLWKGKGILTIDEKGWLAFYIGQSYEAIGDIKNALEYYQAGWQLTTNVRLNGLSALRLLHQHNLDSKDISAQLSTLGPATPLGRVSPGYLEAFPVELSSGWILLGYDIDPEILSNSPFLTIWLWWKKPESIPIPTGQGWIDLGRYVVQRQKVTNLILNPSFEWGVDEKGLPAGWDHRMYTDNMNSLYITTMEKNGSLTQVLEADNTFYPSSGLMGRKFSVQADDWYLMGGLMKATDSSHSNIGRACGGPMFQAKGPYYAHWPTKSIGDAWVQISDLAPAYPNDHPETCQFLLINSESPGGVAVWDDLYIFKIAKP